METYFHQFQSEAGVGIVGYTVSVSTKEPLEEESVRQALSHLWRKIVTLRLIVLPNEEDEYIWFAEMEKEALDLKKISLSDVESTVETLRATAVDSTSGPLWKVRMASSTDGLQHKLVFVFHHSITDGTSTCRIVGHFMNLLNDVLAGRQIDDAEQLTAHTDAAAATRHLVEKFMKDWEENPVNKDKLYREMDEILSQKPLVLSAGLQTDKDVALTTITCQHDFTTEESKDFIKNCKSHKVTVHMAFSIAAQIAIAQLLQKKGISQECYDMVTNHAVNIRRYYQNCTDYSKHSGLAVGMLPIKTSIPSDAKSSFWETAKAFGVNFSEKLNSTFSFESLAYQVEKFTENPDMLNDPPHSSLDLGNMGDITKLVTGDFAKEEPEKEESKRAIVTHVVRSTSIHFNPCFALLNIHSFKGKLLYSMDYNTKYSSPVSAKLYNDCFVDVMKHAANNTQAE